MAKSVRQILQGAIADLDAILPASTPTDTMTLALYRGVYMARLDLQQALKEYSYRCPKEAL